MYLTQILLPLYDGRGRKISRRQFAEIQDLLTRRYGGVTAYTHSPAEGQWQTHGRTARDDIITVEVMHPKPEVRWWKAFRKTLETRFRQEEIVIRSLQVRRI